MVKSSQGILGARVLDVQGEVRRTLKETVHGTGDVQVIKRCIIGNGKGRQDVVRGVDGIAVRVGKSIG